MSHTPTLGPASEPETKDELSLIKIEFPKELTPFVIAAMAIGLLLIGAAASGDVLGWSSGARGSLLFSAGIAIILAAFGGQATVRGKFYVLAGVSALAVLLTWYLEDRRAGDHKREIEEVAARAKDYARGNVHDIPQSPVSLVFGNTIVGSTYINRKDLFSFVVFKEALDEVTSASLRLQTEPPVSIAIAVSCIARAMGSGKPIDWALKQIGDGWEVIDQRYGEEVVGRWGGKKAEPCKSDPKSTQATTSVGDLLGVAQAHADTAPAQPATTSPDELDWLASEIKSEDTAVRRAARDTLSILPPTSVPDIISLLKKDGSYRTKLGVSVALTEMLRRDKSLGSVITTLLTDDDRNMLLDLAGDDDRTVRIYSTEFLYDLGDPAVSKLAIIRAASTENGDARYNWLLAAQDGWRRLPKKDRADLDRDLKNALEKAGPKTKSLMKAFAN